MLFSLKIRIHFFLPNHLHHFHHLDIENIVFLSRHKAASGRPSLTVHPIGNWGAADYGGKEGEISGATPEWMTGLLLNIRKNRIPGYDVCFEATHHGPLLETPTMFLEIGSSESEWEKMEPAEALIKSLLELKPAQKSSRRTD